MEPSDLLPPPGFIEFSKAVLRRHWLKVLGVPFVIESLVGVLLLLVGLFSEQAATNLWSWVLKHPLIVLSPSFLICFWIFACESYGEHQARFKLANTRKRAIRERAHELLREMAARNEEIDQLKIDNRKLADHNKRPQLIISFTNERHMQVMEGCIFYRFGVGTNDGSSVMGVRVELADIKSMTDGTQALIHQLSAMRDCPLARKHDRELKTEHDLLSSETDFDLIYEPATQEMDFSSGGSVPNIIRKGRVSGYWEIYFGITWPPSPRIPHGQYELTVRASSANADAAMATFIVSPDEAMRLVVELADGHDGTVSAQQLRENHEMQVRELELEAARIKRNAAAIDAEGTINASRAEAAARRARARDLYDGR